MEKVSTVIGNEWRDLTLFWLKVKPFGVKPHKFCERYEAMLKELINVWTMSERYRKAKSVLLRAIAAKIRLLDRHGRLITRGQAERALKRRGL